MDRWVVSVAIGLSALTIVQCSRSLWIEGLALNRAFMMSPTGHTRPRRLVPYKKRSWRLPHRNLSWIKCHVHSRWRSSDCLDLELFLRE